MFYVRIRDELIPVPFCRAIEGPYLDGANSPRVDQLLHDLFRFGVEVVLIRESTYCRGAPRDSTCLRSTDRPAHSTIFQQVPQSKIDRAQNAHFGPARNVEIEAAVQVCPDAFNIARIMAQ